MKRVLSIIAILCGLFISSALYSQEVTPQPTPVPTPTPAPTPVPKQKNGMEIQGLPEPGKDWLKGPSREWHTSYYEALMDAQRTRRKLLVLRTGSDWCGYCIKLYKEVFSQKAFQKYAKKNLVLLYLDAPRQKSMPADQQRHNQMVWRKIGGTNGGVPCTIIIDINGKVLNTIMGYRPEEAYIQELDKALGKPNKTKKTRKAE